MCVRVCVCVCVLCTDKVLIGCGGWTSMLQLQTSFHIRVSNTAERQIASLSGLWIGRIQFQRSAISD